MNRPRGFTLIELAVLLLVVGILVMVTIRLVPRAVTEVGQRAGDDSLSELSDALTGFALHSGRLPCPDTDNDGTEDCGAGAAVGGLPYMTLGKTAPTRNPLGLPYRYSVYRSAAADLAVQVNRFEPLLPATVPATVLNNLNGLDFCAALRIAALAVTPTPRLRVGAGGRNVAYLVVDPGAGDADGDGMPADGDNGGADTSFEEPGRALTASYDDRVMAVGFNRLAIRLGCPAAMATVNGLARAAVAAEDLRRLADFYKQFRDFNKRYADGKVLIASAKLALATFILIYAKVSTTTAIILAIQTAGVTLPLVIAAGINNVAAVLALAKAIVFEGLAIKGVITAINQVTAANTALTEAITFAADSLDAAEKADQKGLYQ